MPWQGAEASKQACSAELQACCDQAYRTSSARAGTLGFELVACCVQLSGSPGGESEAGERPETVIDVADDAAMQYTMRP